MRLIPNGDKKHLVHGSGSYGTEIVPEAMPDTEPVIGECKEGEIVIMNQFVPHMSTPNLTETCRWTMDLRYQRTGTPSARPWLPEFVVLSESNPNSVFDDYDAWCEQWENPAPMPKGLSFHRHG